MIDLYCDENKELLKSEHPKLLYTKETVERLKKEIHSDPRVMDGWAQLMDKAEKYLAEEFFPEEYADAVNSQHGNYGKPGDQMMEMGVNLGLAYQVTGEVRFAEKLKDALIYYSNYKKWCGSGILKQDPPWTSELNTTKFLYGYSLGFDSIYHFLKEGERKQIVDAMVCLGITPLLNDWLLPEKRVHALDSMGHNWWIVCVSQAGFGALAVIGEIPEAEGWVNLISDMWNQWFSYTGNVLQNKSMNFDNKGGFYESIGYTKYGLYEFLLFRCAYLNLFGRDKAPVMPMLEKVGDFLIKCCYPTSSAKNPYLMVNFGDSSLTESVSQVLKLLLVCGYENPTFRWCIERQDPSYDVFDLLHTDVIRRKPAASPDSLGLSEIYQDIGWAVMRSSWEDDARLLAVKAGFTWNHAHADIGSFILFNQGKPLIIDSGSCSYGKPEYLSYYCQSEAHNVVLFNGKGQDKEDIYRGVKEQGRIYNLIDTELLKYVYVDATGPMSRYFTRNFRHFLWLGDVLLIIDDIRTFEEGEVGLQLHFAGNYEIKDGTVLIDNDGIKAGIYTLFPREVSIIEREGLEANNPDIKVPYLSFSSMSEERNAKYITAIVMNENKEQNNIRLERLEGSEMFGVRIFQKGRCTDVYLNLRADGRRMHINSNNSIEGWETDAYILAITREEGSSIGEFGAMKQYFMACGSYLRKNGRVIFDSLSKVFTAINRKGTEIDVVLQGQPEICADIYSEEKPVRLGVNGENEEIAYNEIKKTIRINVKREHKNQ